MFEVFLVQKPLRRAQSVADGLGGTVVDGIDDAVFVQIILYLAVFILDAKLPMGLGNRRTRKGKTLGVGQHGTQFHLIITVFRAVGFIDEHDDIVALVLDLTQLLEFLNGSDEHARRLVSEYAFQVANTHHHPRVRKHTVEEGVVHLVLQVLAVHHDENGGVVQGFGLAEFVGSVKHGERLARTLGVPNHALRLVGLHYPIDNLVGGTQLLVTRHFLDDLVVVALKHNEMLQDVEHALGLQQTDDAELHLFQ